MMKKLMSTGVIFVVSSGVAFAEPYVGLGGGLQTVGGNFGLTGNVFAGSGTKLGENKNFYLGGEVFADIGSIPLSRNNMYHRATIGLGASILPGIMLTQNTMAFARFGVETFHDMNVSGSRTGGQLGLGLQTKLSDRWSVRGEFDRTGEHWFNNFGSNGTNRVNVGFVYHIN